jgi:hypothetical protein
METGKPGLVTAWKHSGFGKSFAHASSYINTVGPLRMFMDETRRYRLALFSYWSLLIIAPAVVLFFILGASSSSAGVSFGVGVVLAIIGEHGFRPWKRLWKVDTSGDFAQFFVSEVHARGGKTLRLDSPPVITGRWQVERDEFGFQVHLFGVEFATIDSFMTGILGEPKILESTNLEGEPHRMYDRQNSGMHIQLVGKVGEVYVVAVGPKK